MTDNIHSATKGSVLGRDETQGAQRESGKGCICAWPCEDQRADGHFGFRAETCVERDDRTAQGRRRDDVRGIAGGAIAGRDVRSCGHQDRLVRGKARPERAAQVLQAHQRRDVVGFRHRKTGVHVRREPRSDLVARDFRVRAPEFGEQDLAMRRDHVGKGDGRGPNADRDPRLAAACSERRDGCGRRCLRAFAQHRILEHHDAHRCGGGQGVKPQMVGRERRSQRHGVRRRIAERARRIEGRRQRKDAGAGHRQRGGLEGTDAAIGGGPVHGARRLRADGEWHRAGGDGGGRSAGGAAGRAGQIVRIACRRDGFEIGVFGGVDFTQDDCTRGAQVGNERRIRHRRRDIGAAGAVGARRQSLDVDDVLDGDWDAVQGPAHLAGRPLAIETAGSFERVLLEHMDPGLHLRVDFADAGKAALDERDRGQLSRSHGGREVVHAAGILGVAHACALRPARSSARRAVVAATSTARLSSSISPVKTTP